MNSSSNPINDKERLTDIWKRVSPSSDPFAPPPAADASLDESLSDLIKLEADSVNLIRSILPGMYTSEHLKQLHMIAVKKQNFIAKLKAAYFIILGKEYTISHRSQKYPSQKIVLRQLVLMQSVLHSLYLKVPLLCDKVDFLSQLCMEGSNISHSCSAIIRKVLEQSYISNRKS